MILLFHLKHDLFLACQFLLNQIRDSIQMAFFIYKIKVIRADLQYRAQVKSTHPIIVKGIQQGKILQADARFYFPPSLLNAFQQNLRGGDQVNQKIWLGQLTSD